MGRCGSQAKRCRRGVSSVRVECRLRTLAPSWCEVSIAEPRSVPRRTLESVRPPSCDTLLCKRDKLPRSVGNDRPDASSILPHSGSTPWHKWNIYRGLTAIRATCTPSPRDTTERSRDMSAHNWPFRGGRCRRHSRVHMLRHKRCRRQCNYGIDRVSP